MISSLFLAFVLFFQAGTGQVSLAWDPSVSTGVVGYKMYFGNAPRTYGVPITLGNVTVYTVTGLNPGSTYYFTVTAFDDVGNESDYSNEVFTIVADTTAPTISAVAVSNITSTGATIVWTTNETSNTQVEYGTTIAYGSLTTLNSALVTVHSTVLSALLPSTVYHYRVKSRDAAGNLATSTDYTFTTIAIPKPNAPTNFRVVP